MMGVIARFQTLKLDMRTRIVITVVFFVVALIATMVGAIVLTIDMSDAQKLKGQIEEEFSLFNDPRSIFGNNFAYTLVMFIPIVGPIWGNFVLFNTGAVVAIFGVAEGIPPILLLLFLLFTPVFWLEFGVYSVAMAQSVVLFIQMLRHRGREEAMRTCVVIAVCAVVLLLSAVIEWLLYI
jgi:hypothetical protein